MNNNLNLYKPNFLLSGITSDFDLLARKDLLKERINDSGILYP